MLLKMPRFFSAPGMFAQASFHAIIRKNTASLMSKVQSSHNNILKKWKSGTNPIWRPFVYEGRFLNKACFAHKVLRLGMYLH